jgi:hypothetical protein
VYPEAKMAATPGIASPAVQARFAPVAVDSGKWAKMAALPVTEPRTLDCRPNCGACCIAPSITSLGKLAGVACSYLDAALRCTIFGRPERPACCSGLQPSAEMCGVSREQALRWLADLEARTRPG